MVKNYIIGIDLGATNIKIGLIRKRRIVLRAVVPTATFGIKENLIAGLSNAASGLFLEADITKNNVAGIGIGVPGPVDFSRGVVHFFPNIKGWCNVALKSIMQKKTHLPVVIDNDANLMSLAETRIGAAIGLKNVIGITLGTGVGGGIIINGELYRGSSFCAGEAGHIPLNEAGPKCNCGGRACIERYVGNRYILRNVRKTFGKGINLEALSRLAHQGNAKAIGIWNGVAGHLGVGLSGIINFLNPDAVVIGGGVSNAGKFIFDKAREVIKERSMPTQAKTVKILKAKLGNDAGMIGAALLVEETLVKNEN